MSEVRSETGDEPGTATPDESGDDRRVVGLLLVYAGTLFVVQFLGYDGLRVTAGSLWRLAMGAIFVASGLNAAWRSPPAGWPPDFGRLEAVMALLCLVLTVTTVVLVWTPNGL